MGELVSCEPLWTVHCNGGERGCHGKVAKEDNKTSARKTAKARGWLVNHKSDSGLQLDYCPACRKVREL